MCPYRQPSKKGKREAIWRVMRCRHKTGREFTIADLAIATGASAGAVAGFVRLLCLAGALERRREKGPGGSRSAYRVAKDLGPKCPSNRKGGLFDPNSREYLEMKETRKYNKRQGGQKC